jgi:ferredoxin
MEIEIDGKVAHVPDGSTIMDAAQQLGAYIPHFCYHKKLSIAANCRMCLVQVEKAPKPLPACATPVTNGMRVFTHSELAVKAQKGRDGVPADQPPARLPNLRSGWRMPVAGFGGRLRWQCLPLS